MVVAVVAETVTCGESAGEGGPLLGLVALSDLQASRPGRASAPQSRRSSAATSVQLLRTRNGVTVELAAIHKYCGYGDYRSLCSEKTKGQKFIDSYRRGFFPQSEKTKEPKQAERFS